MEKIINLLFWGFLSKPWKRLFRTISSIVILISLTIFFNSDDDDVIIPLTLIIISIPVLSYIIEPFINKGLPKSDNYKKDGGHDLIVTEKRSGINKTDEELREVGRKFLDELKEKGPDLSRVGQTFVRTTKTPLTETKGEEFDDESKTREFRKLRIDFMKEFLRGGDSKKDNV